MGGSSSKSKSDIFLSSVNDALVKNVNKCTSSSTITQKISIDGDGNIIEGGSMVAAQKLSLSCDQSSQAMIDMQNNVAAAIKQAAAAQNEALLGALQSSSSNVDTTIHNDVQNHINLQNIQGLINQTNAAQGIDIHGDHNIVRNFTMSETQDILAANSQKILQQMTTVNKITEQLDQEATSKNTNPISEIIDNIGNAIANVWNALTGPLKWIVIIIAIVLVAYLFSGAFGSADSPPNPAFQNLRFPQMRMPPGMQRYNPPGMMSPGMTPGMTPGMMPPGMTPPYGAPMYYQPYYPQQVASAPPATQ